MHFLPVFELMSDSLTAIYVVPHECPSHQSILLTQGPICKIFAKKLWELAILKISVFFSLQFWIFFFKKKKIFFCFISMKISPNLYGRMDGSKCFPWFPENSLLCVILRYTVYIWLNAYINFHWKYVSVQLWGWFQRDNASQGFLFSLIHH